MHIVKVITVVGFMCSGILYGMDTEEGTYATDRSFDRLDTPTVAELIANLDQVHRRRGSSGLGLDSSMSAQQQIISGEESSQSGTIVRHSPGSELPEIGASSIPTEMPTPKPGESWPTHLMEAVLQGGRKVAHPERYQRKPLAGVIFEPQLKVAPAKTLEESPQAQSPRHVPTVSYVYGIRFIRIKKLLGYLVPGYYPHSEISSVPCDGDFGTVAIENHLKFKTTVSNHTLVKMALSGVCALPFILHCLRTIVKQTRFSRASYARAFVHGISVGISGICAYACNKFFERRHYKQQLQTHITNIADGIYLQELVDLEKKFEHDRTKMNIVRQIRQLKQQPSH